MLLAFLPGLKFTIWVGWAIGVIFTSHKSPSAKRRKFKVLHLAYAILLDLCILTVLVDGICNVLPSLSTRHSIADHVGQGLATYYAVLLAAYRLYLLIISKPLSSFVKSLDDSGSFLASKLSSFKLWTNTSILLFFCCMAWESVNIARDVVQLQRVSLWVSTEGNVVFQLLVAFVVWHAAMVRFLPLAIAISLLDRLLDVVESFVNRAKSTVGVASASTFGKRRVNRETSSQLRLEMNNLEIQHLLSELQKIQEFFYRYDQLLGPLILLLLSNSFIGLIDAISEVVQSKVEELERPSRLTKCVALINHLLPFTLLNVGYLAKSRIKHLRISLKREIAAAMICSRNEGLMNLYRNIEDWSWKMSAAGFFTVDRSLVTKIASAALTYVVLLFQIQGVLKAGTGDDDQLRQQLFRLLKSLNRTKFATQL